ncbi:hypothetical protein F4824DRAFT_41877 [Ustulina deusta]|nr:hypothetical protein F4824DRAFT_41877 [Ustulina deusta]
MGHHLERRNAARHEDPATTSSHDRSFAQLSIISSTLYCYITSLYLILLYDIMARKTTGALGREDRRRSSHAPPCIAAAPGADRVVMVYRSCIPGFSPPFSGSDKHSQPNNQYCALPAIVVGSTVSTLTSSSQSTIGTPWRVSSLSRFLSPPLLKLGSAMGWRAFTVRALGM